MHRSLKSAQRQIEKQENMEKLIVRDFLVLNHYALKCIGCPLD